MTDTTQDVERLIERLRYRIENPSAWPEGFDQDGSDLMRDASTTIRRLSASLAEAERDLADERSNKGAEIQDMSERFRAVNIARVVEQSGVDFVALAARAEAAEARVKVLEAERLAAADLLLKKGYEADESETLHSAIYDLVCDFEKAEAERGRLAERLAEAEKVIGEVRFRLKGAKHTNTLNSGWHEILDRLEAMEGEKNG